MSRNMGKPFLYEVNPFPPREKYNLVSRNTGRPFLYEVNHFLPTEKCKLVSRNTGRPFLYEVNPFPPREKYKLVSRNTGKPFLYEVNPFPPRENYKLESRNTGRPFLYDCMNLTLSRRGRNIIWCLEIREDHFLYEVNPFPPREKYKLVSRNTGKLFLAFYFRYWNNPIVWYWQEKFFLIFEDVMGFLLLYIKILWAFYSAPPIMASSFRVKGF